MASGNSSNNRLSAYIKIYRMVHVRAMVMRSAPSAPGAPSSPLPSSYSRHASSSSCWARNTMRGTTVRGAAGVYMAFSVVTTNAYVSALASAPTDAFLYIKTWDGQEEAGRRYALPWCGRTIVPFGVIEHVNL